MITCYDVVKAMVRSEKGTSLEKERKYLFRVATVATKIDVAQDGDDGAVTPPGCGARA